MDPLVVILIKSIIYALLDDAGIVRYIGKVSRLSLEERLYKHIQDARRGHRNRRCIWIRSLLARGASPTIISIKIVEGDGQQEERELIAQYRANGHNLVNGTDGGEGALGRPASEKTRKAVAEANRRRVVSEQQKLRNSLAHKGKMVLPEVRLKISASRKASEKVRADVEARRGRELSSEHKANISSALKGREHSLAHTVNQVVSRKRNRAMRNGFTWMDISL